MELNEFVRKFAELCEDTDVNEIKADTAFQELDEWDSLFVLSIIAFAKTSYGKNITGKEIRSCATVEELFRLIKEE